jgi:hypothetical protein
MTYFSSSTNSHHPTSLPYHTTTTPRQHYMPLLYTNFHYHTTAPLTMTQQRNDTTATQRHNNATTSTLQCHTPPNNDTNIASTPTRTTTQLGWCCYNETTRGGVATMRLPVWMVMVSFYDLIFGEQVSPSPSQHVSWNVVWLKDGYFVANTTQSPPK